MINRAILVVFIFSLSAAAQRINVTQQHSSGISCVGRLWLVNQHVYCKDFKSQSVSKSSFDGYRAFDRLKDPAPLNHSFHLAALTEDSVGNIVITDGARVIIYGPDGSPISGITPGVQMALSIVALDGGHFLVAGHAPWGRADSTASIFKIGPNGVEMAFSSPFFPNATGPEGMSLNTPSWLAVDQTNHLIYQASQYLYEIRVFNLNGDFQRRILPPNGYNLRPPNVVHISGGVGIDPSDTIDDMSVLADGRIAVLGSRVTQSSRVGNNIQAAYAPFLDIFTPDGQLLRRYEQKDLQAAGLPFLALDHRTGRIAFANTQSSLEAEIH